MTGARPELWAQAWDLAPCGYLILDDGGTVLEANQEVLRSIRQTREDLIGKRRLVDLLTAGGQIYHETHLMPSLRLHGTVSELALDLRGPGGRRIPVLISARRVAPPDEPPTIHVVIFDASQRRDYELEILHAKQLAEAAEAKAVALSRTLQATFVPPLPPTIEGLDVASAYRPAGTGAEVGGDFFDVFQINPDEWVITIGDVQGKGVQAATDTALARHVMRAAAVRSHSPREALITLNEVLRGADTTRLLTAVVTHWIRQGSGWRVILASGGHEPPVLRRSGAAVEQVSCRGMILGAIADPSFSEARLTLAAGDLVLLTTDGIHEARNPDTQDFYGVERLLELVDSSRNCKADDVITALLADVLAFSRQVTRDDVALVAAAVT